MKCLGTGLVGDLQTGGEAVAITTTDLVAPAGFKASLFGRTRAPDPDGSTKPGGLMSSAAHVVVGGGYAAVAAVRRFRELRPDAPVTWVTDRPDLLLRSRMITLPLSEPKSVTVALDAVASALSADLVVSSVHRIDLRERSVHFGAGDVSYDSLIIATGAVSDRASHPGAADVLHPCERGDAVSLAQAAGRAGRVLVVATGQRPGPAVEWAAHVAAVGAAEVTLVDDAGVMQALLGQRGWRLVSRRLSETGRGAQVVEGVVANVAPSAVELADGRRIEADVVALCGALCGTPVGLPPELLDERGFVRCTDRLQIPGHHPGFAAGDIVSLAGMPALQKTWVFAERMGAQAATNAIRVLNGQPPEPPKLGRAARAAMALPDLHGYAVLTRNRRVLLRGGVAARLKERMEKRYLRTLPQATR